MLRKLLIAGIIVLFVIALGIAVVDRLASWHPSAYRPPQLQQAEKEQWAKAFYGDLQAFNNAGQGTEPYDWVLREDDLNNYLASMDEIVAVQPSRKRGEVQKVLDTAGLVEPVVRLDDGRLTIMLRSNERGMVASTDLRIGMTEDGQIRVQLDGVRVGVLPVPRFAIRSQLEDFKIQLQERLDRLQEMPEKTGRAMILPSFAPVDQLMATLVLAIDEKPLPSQIKVIRKRVQIEQITIADGEMTMRIIPVAQDNDNDD
ncbi:MAG: hypothetical protein ACYS8X_06095 [Planctomycetota bacterium]|jgi:hypothetical protein